MEFLVFSYVYRAQQFRMLHMQGEVQFVMEAAAARADLTLDEDLLGRHAVAGVAI